MGKSLVKPNTLYAISSFSRIVVFDFPCKLYISLSKVVPIAIQKTAVFYTKFSSFPKYSVSTQDQTLNLQKDALTFGFAVAIIYQQ